MNSIKRLELIDKIASKLQQDYVTPDINIILGKFGIAANGSMPKSKKTYVKNLLSPTIDSTIINIASDLGFDVTEYQEDLIHNQTSEEINKAEYVNLGRILELKNVASPDFDLTILIKLCEELNDTYKNEHYYSTAMLVRAIIDHIPPIFGKGNFVN